MIWWVHNDFSLRCKLVSVGISISKASVCSERGEGGRKCVCVWEREIERHWEVLRDFERKAYLAINTILGKSVVIIKWLVNRWHYKSIKEQFRALSKNWPLRCVLYKKKNDSSKEFNILRKGYVTPFSFILTADSHSHSSLILAPLMQKKISSWDHFPLSFPERWNSRTAFLFIFFTH